MKSKTNKAAPKPPGSAQDWLKRETEKTLLGLSSGSSDKGIRCLVESSERTKAEGAA
jgi:hypothetical protein